ncbi:MAG: AI-2E family transporter, partial [Clostridiales bacterium]|nr:AI-2E family transporter [Clostridiales bacterium]
VIISYISLEVYTNLGILPIFQNFVLGKLLDAIVLGVMCFVGMAILRIPYALVISVVIGVTNMIPYVGPFIGTVPAVFIVLLVSPIKALWLLIYILAIQQVDNYFICPRLLGDPTGLTPLEVLFAIAVGAYFGGAFGMFLGVPIVASIKLFVSEAINRRYREKYPHGSPEFPDDGDDIWADGDFSDDIPDD